LPQLAEAPFRESVEILRRRDAVRFHRSDLTFRLGTIAHA
jgi:hypothetical protein